MGDGGLREDREPAPPHRAGEAVRDAGRHDTEAALSQPVKDKEEDEEEAQRTTRTEGNTQTTLP